MAEPGDGSPIDPNATRRRSDLFRELREAEAAKHEGWTPTEPEAADHTDAGPTALGVAVPTSPIEPTRPTEPTEPVEPVELTENLPAEETIVSTPVTAWWGSLCPSCSAPMDARYDHCPRCGRSRTAGRSAAAAIRTATVTALIAGLVIAGVAFGVGAATNDDAGVSSSSFDFDTPATTRYEPATTRPYVPSTTSVITGTETALTPGTAGGYAFTGRDERGYSSRVALSVDQPIKAADARSSSLQRKLRACVVDPTTDAVVPVRMQITNTTASFSEILGFSLRVSDDPGDLEVASDIVYSTGPTCASSASSSNGRVYGIEYSSPLAPNASASSSFYLVLHNYFSPNTPAGDRARYETLELSPTLSFGDTDGSDARFVTSISKAPLGPAPNAGPVFELAGISTPSSTPTPAAGTRSYALQAELNLRSGPNTSSAALGLVPDGTFVVVSCTIAGERVEGGPHGPDSNWDRVTYRGTTGYLSNAFVNTGADISDRSKIPLC